MNNESPWIVSHGSPTPRLRLFCFPYAGGGASVFASWSKHLDPSVEVCAVQMPGRERRIFEKPLDDMDVVTDTLCRVLLKKMNVPFIFFGHSLGGLTSFALYRELLRRGLPTPKSLLLSGCRPPCEPEPRPIYHLGEEDFIDALRIYNGTPEEVLQNKELMDLLMPLLRADFSLAETYTDRDVRKFDVDMTVFSGNRDADASPELMAGWKAYAGRGFRQHVIEGEHFFLNTNRVLLLNYVNAILVRTLQGTCPEASFQREYAYRPAM